MKNVAFFVVMLVLAGVSFSLANVSTCSVLNVTGETYTVNASLSGAPIPASTGNACLVISADDILLDCQGNTISHDDSANTEAIIVNATASPLNNITIRNCRIRDYASGVFVESPGGGRNAVTLTNNTISSNSYGVRIPGVWADVVMIGNLVANNTNSGYFMDDYFGGTIDMARDRFLGNTADINYTAGMSGFTMSISDVIFGDADGTYGANTSVTHSSSSRSWGILDWVQSPAAPSANHVSFLNKSVNITPDYIDLNGDKLFTVTMKWTVSEGGSALQESGIQMWLINDSGNYLLNGSPDMSGNEISASVYLNDSINSSVFALYRKTGCPVITSPGVYIMDGNMSGAPNGGSNGRDACVLIDSDDVVFDCAGYFLSHDDSGNSAGIMVNGTGGNRDNITIKNCNIRDYDAGILVDSTSSARQTVNITNNTLASNAYGVSVPLGYAYVYMRDNLVANSTTDGFLDSSYFGDIINMSRDRFYGNGNDLEYPSGGSSLTISVADVLFGDAGASYAANASISHSTSSMTWGIIDWVPAPPPPSLTLESFLNKSFNITHSQMDQEKLFDISVKWLPSESAPIDESTIELWMINGSGSFLLNSTPDTSANTITSSLNLTAVSPSTVIGLYYTPSGTNITSCKLINVPGEYNVTSDLTGSTIPMLPGNHTACIWINVSNVHLDCRGHTLTGNATHDGTNHTFGIVASNSSNPGIDNISISNCIISNYTTGLYASVTNSSITNNTAFNNTHPGYFATDTVGFGFKIDAQDSNISSNNGSYNNASMYLHTQFSRISNNSGYGSYNHGFLLEELENVTLANNTVCGSAREGFFFIGDTFNNEIRNNTICDNGQASGRSGFDVGTSVNVFFNNIVDGNHLYGNGLNGIHFSAEVGWIDKNDNVFSNNLVHGNNESGIYYYSDGTGNYNNTFVNNTLYSNMGQTEGADFFSTTYNTTINTTFFNTTSISMSYFDNLFINATNGPGPVPPGYASFHGKYVQIENFTTSPPTVAEIKFHYTDAEASGVTESGLRIMEYSGGSWILLGSQSVNEPGNYVLASNVSSFNSTFGLFLPSCATPSDNYLVNASTTFCPGTYYLNDSGSPGIIIANSNNTNITCDNTIIIGNGSGSGFNLTRKSNTLLSGCTIVNYYNGIDLMASSSNTLSNNTLLNSTNAVFVRPNLANSYYNVIENNTVGNASVGVYLYDFSSYQVGYTNITGNVIENCSNYGVFLEMRGYFGDTLMAYNRVANNNISNCTNSVRMYAGDNGLAYNRFNVFEDNILRNGTYGVYLDVQDSRHSLSYNNFSSNAFSDFSSGYAVFFADNLVYANDFGGSNTFNGYSFYHYANRQNQSVSGLDLDSNNDATNLGMFTIVNSNNISVSGANITGDREFGVYLWSNNLGSILGSNISGNGPGTDEANVFVFNESGSSISNNVIASAYNGVFLNASTGVKVLNNTIRNATLAAVSIYGTSSSNVSDNALTNSTYAVFVRPTVANSYYNVIDGNTLGGTTTGVYLYDFSSSQIGYNNITGNTIENCSSYGVFLEVRASSSSFMGYNRVADNNISNCTNSVRMFAGDNGLAHNQFNSFEDNIFRNGTYGVYLDVQDSRHSLSYNNFSSNAFSDFSSGYAVYFADNLVYANDFGGSNTFNGYSFYHYAYRQNQSISGLDLDSNNDATNLGMFTIANSNNISVSGSQHHGRPGVRRIPLEQQPGLNPRLQHLGERPGHRRGQRVRVQRVRFQHIEQRHRLGLQRRLPQRLYRGKSPQQHHQERDTGRSQHLRHLLQQYQRQCADQLYLCGVRQAHCRQLLLQRDRRQHPRGHDDGRLPL